MIETTSQGVSTSTSTPEKELKGPQPDLKRFDQLEEMADKVEQERINDIEALKENDPGFKAQEEVIAKEELIAQAEIDTQKEGLEHKESFEVVDGEPVIEREEKQKEIPVELQEDPLADYIVMEEEVPMFKAKIDGKEVLIPLDRARAQIQKGEAAEVRLQRAVVVTKQLDLRTEALHKNEQALHQRIALMNNPPSKPTLDVDDEARFTQAKKVITTLFSGSEDDAAKELAKVLSNNRAPATTAPAINTEALINQAAELAEGRMVQRQEKLDSKKGYKEFRKEYPDIITDSKLFLIADSMIDEITAENPDWNTPEIMLEAGKRTLEWRDGKTQPVIDVSSDTADRQSRKAQLIPMPRSADAKPVKEPEETTQTVAEAVAEMRASRGQEG